MSILSKFSDGLSNLMYAILQIFETLTLVFVMCSANGCVASISKSKSELFMILIISSFRRGRDIVSSLPASAANFDPYSVVVVVKIWVL